MKLKVSKKAIFLFLALIVIGLFICFFLLPETFIPQEVKNKEGIVSATELSISSVYRYDFKEQNYVSDEGNSWQNSDFTRYVYDVAPAGATLEKCYYFLYDNVKKETTFIGQRKCNANLTITVGENKNCLSQGELACTLYIYAVDNVGNLGEMAAVTYHIDWESPKIGKPYQENQNFISEVSDNIEVNYCWFYLDGENRGAMKIENGLATFNYKINEEEKHAVYVRCADQYNAEKEEYLNIASSGLFETVAFKNQPPKISSCKVSPTQGNKGTNFSFQIEASDPNGDNLNYNWYFGDGRTSNEKNPNHYYSLSGTFEPKVIISDGRENTVCATAWVIVSK
ncbi:MAG: hypothetical protein A2175_01310 [Candidatus Nealsonbacteria bacterium RBG_13_42_11]|uniref:PKD domain-containing protein n=1 Tax=Candidatus Nealsonbacteria bacterium RBG_13_42_11 TaxID=1801663 RepID=A0A1G2DZK3_9BACT|nr:MAG: hypothetical protein A2175_01310 [Candidatus Nealsonbacteria bacterium RBG_13_42_11]